jgi:hypothetical protein
MTPQAAALVLEKALAGRTEASTIADATAKSGLALRDAESGMHALVSEYRGHLRVTADGDLLFVFPHGFTKPWEAGDRARDLARRAGRAALGAARFMVRAWISVVLVAYALIFLALVIALMFARSGDSRGERGLGFEVIYVFLRIVADALFWTFHPFSPFAYADIGAPPARGRRHRRKKDETPFYEKVNRFFFGPEIPAPDPRAEERRILAEIRAQKGRIGLGEVIRVTGLPREQAEPLLSRLMLDYDGEIDVSEEGAIVYRFEALRRTADEAEPHRPRPIWERIRKLAPLTGNSWGTNFMIAGLNGFNLVVSLYALAEGLTLDKVGWLLERAGYHGPPELFRPAPTGTAIALGLVPLVFSLALFALPLVRAALRPWKERRIARENGRRAALREILEHHEVSDAALRAAWKQAAGAEPKEAELNREIVALGGDVDGESGEVRYRFPDLDAEARALAAEREAAAEGEAKVGEVVFTSER